MKDREHFCVIRPYGDALLLATLHYPDEIMKSDQLQIPQTEPGKSELSLATELINKFSGKFTPENFRDSYREALMELIEAKIAGRQIAVPPPPRPAKVISLMDALKKSLERASPKRPKAGRPAAPKSLKRKTAKAAKAHP
jgi:DNA end-binding protein Ku